MALQSATTGPRRRIPRPVSVLGSCCSEPRPDPGTHTGYRPDCAFPPPPAPSLRTARPLAIAHFVHGHTRARRRRRNKCKAPFLPKSRTAARASMGRKKKSSTEITLSPAVLRPTSDARYEAKAVTRAGWCRGGERRQRKSAASLEEGRGRTHVSRRGLHSVAVMWEMEGSACDAGGYSAKVRRPALSPPAPHAWPRHSRAPPSRTAGSARARQNPRRRTGNIARSSWYSLRPSHSAAGLDRVKRGFRCLRGSWRVDGCWHSVSGVDAAEG